MRNDLLLMRPYLQTCREVARLCLLRHLRPYGHFIDTSDVYSMQDLIDIADGILATRFRETLDIFRQHIKVDCDACRGNGYLCELCGDQTLLFPFDEFIGICRQCSAVFHRVFSMAYVKK
ncbi:unnamed protein product [Soboliphyme baturini]|uniref:DUF4206 domain-containing protein n=1 Tax=Soboliphyme baturini TaxID=241478 RepID=A0A183J688_9BILA|nr:unnamed protein product [Soboliphyme baturini]